MFNINTVKYNYMNCCCVVAHCSLSWSFINSEFSSLFNVHSFSSFMNNYQLFMDDNNFISSKVNFTREHRKVYALIVMFMRGL